MIMRVEQFYKNREWCKCWLDIYVWDVGLAVTCGIRGNGQKVLLSCFQTGSISSPSYFHICFVIAFLEEACIRNIIITLCINYIFIIYIGDNKAVVNNNIGRLRDLILLFKIPMGTRKNFLEIYRQFGHAPSKRSPIPGLEEWNMRTDTKNSPVKCTFFILLHVLILSLTSLTFALSPHSPYFKLHFHLR